MTKLFILLFCTTCLPDFRCVVATKEKTVSSAPVIPLDVIGSSLIITIHL